MCSILDKLDGADTRILEKLRSNAFGSIHAFTKYAQLLTEISANNYASRISARVQLSWHYLGSSHTRQYQCFLKALPIHPNVVADTTINEFFRGKSVLKTSSSSVEQAGHQRYCRDTKYKKPWRLRNSWRLNITSQTSMLLKSGKTWRFGQRWLQSESPLVLLQTGARVQGLQQFFTEVPPHARKCPPVWSETSGDYIQVARDQDPIFSARAETIGDSSIFFPVVKFVHNCVSTTPQAAVMLKRQWESLVSEFSANERHTNGWMLEMWLISEIWVVLTIMASIF